MKTLEKQTLRKITRGYQITLPSDFRDRYHLHVGDHVELIEKDGQLVIAPMNAQREQMASNLAQLFAENPETELTDEEAMALAIEEIKATRAERKERSSLHGE